MWLLLTYQVGIYDIPVRLAIPSRRMTLRLSVTSTAWNNRVAQVTDAYGELIPVVKGNGYGFGLPTLIPRAAAISPIIAVGSVFEVHVVPSTHTAMVLTPAGIELPTSLPSQSILTVGSRHHVDVLQRAGWRGQVIVKLQSSMRRYGATLGELSPLLGSIQQAGLVQVGWAVHPPLESASGERVTDVSDWLSQIQPGHPVYVSHLDPVEVDQLRTTFPRHHIVARVGTALWLGDKTGLQLDTEVLDVRQVSAGMTAGYRNVTIPVDGSLVLVGAGTAHGVHTVGDQLSPFHFQRTRLELLEPSHMHTSMLFVDSGSPCPHIDDVVEVQQSLTRVAVDVILWK